MSKKYQTILADPPWDYSEGFAYAQPNAPAKKVALPYPSMSIQEISDLPVRDLASTSCRLFLWTTNRYLNESFAIMSAWGFRYRQTLVWHKKGVSPLTGSVAPNSAEFLMVAVKGMPPRLGRLPDAVIAASTESHSKKPELWIDWIETVSPGPYLEMFARRNRFGWDTWGNESFCDVQMEALEETVSGFPEPGQPSTVSQAVKENTIEEEEREKTPTETSLSFQIERNE